MKRIISLVLLIAVVFATATVGAYARADGFESKITYENLSMYCGSNANAAESFENIRGILIEFGDEGYQSAYPYDEPMALCTQNEILYVLPGNGQWNWMDETAVRFTDRVLDLLISHFELDAEIPIVATGHGMGGAGAFVFSAYSTHSISAVAANSPICDLFAYANSHPNAWRCYIRALGDYKNMTFNEAIASVSPVYIIDKLPDIPCYIVHGKSDGVAPYTEQSDVFVAMLEAKGFDVTYKAVDGMTHVAMPQAEKDAYYAFAIAQILQEQGE